MRQRLGSNAADATMRCLGSTTPLTRGCDLLDLGIGMLGAKVIDGCNHNLSEYPAYVLKLSRVCFKAIPPSVTKIMDAALFRLTLRFPSALQGQLPR